ncbi:MAG: trypsin-like peptidase domain-containing protein, partial [Proteobacteria bacterium]|nr:trypsin-like peptidase domain-containing protein [Pseudomonadota bacterium]
MNNRFVFLAGLIFLLLIQPVSAKENPALQQMINESRARADVVESTQKGVVHIQVEKIYRTNASGAPYNNPYDLFNDEFFNQFFPGWQGNRRSPGQPREYKQQGAGSGAIVNSKGHILTNNHVVGEADKIMVRLFDGREYEAKIVGTDPLTDIAVIRINAKNLDAVPMGDSDKIRIGETVIAIGNPFGLSHTVTMGIVSAKGRSNVDIADYEDFIQTDAAINP